MNPETYAWKCLCEHAASRLSPGFADRTLLAARKSQAISPGQFFLSVSAATLCLLTVVVFYTQNMRAERSRNLAGWQQIAFASDDVSQAP
jgi:hypothetical protein